MTMTARTLIMVVPNTSELYIKNTCDINISIKVVFLDIEPAWCIKT